MWRGLFLLTFCGTLALGADVCGDLPTRPSELSNYSQRPGTASFRLSVRPGGPAFRITIRPLLFKRTDDLVRAGDIEVASCQDGRRLQSLTIMAWQPINFAATFDPVDVNFDGYADFSVLKEFGGLWGGQAWWIYDPASGKFVENELTRELGKLGNNGYHLDPKKHEFITDSTLAGCPTLVARYRLEDNHLVKVHEEIGIQLIDEGAVRDDLPRGVPCTVTISDLVGGAMRVTGKRRFIEGEAVK